MINKILTIILLSTCGVLFVIAAYFMNFNLYAWWGLVKFLGIIFIPVFLLVVLFYTLRRKVVVDGVGQNLISSPQPQKAWIHVVQTVLTIVAVGSFAVAVFIFATERGGDGFGVLIVLVILAVVFAPSVILWWVIEGIKPKK